MTDLPTKALTSAEGDADMVTLCAWTRTIRYEQEWISVEEYLRRRYGVGTSHGISPLAMEQFDGDLDSPATLLPGMAQEDRTARHSPRRLAALQATKLLDISPVAAFDRLTRLGSRLLDVPVTFISLVDEHRDFYISNCGFGEPLASDRQLTGQTFCHLTIETEAPLVIPDTRGDPVYRNVPTVESLGVAAYLGAPLVLISGEVIGAFCAIDVKPHQWTTAEIQDAVDLASLVVSEIELRHMALAINPPQWLDSPPGHRANSAAPRTWNRPGTGR